MEKTRISLDIILPEVPNERDECVHRIIKEMAAQKGIGKVHIIPVTDTSKAQLCFHYEPNEISLDKIQELAKNAGAKLTLRYGHLMLRVKGIRHVRHARLIESNLKDKDLSSAVNF